METVSDFEDLLRLFLKRKVEYLIIGGLAFIYHAKPRYTKDMDILVGNNIENIHKANKALAEFGCPYLLSSKEKNKILQIGLPPNRIDLMLQIPGVRFESAWKKRIKGYYGKVKVNWIDMDSLIRSKRKLKNPRHKEDVLVLLKVRDLRKGKSRKRRFSQYKIN
ncbi:hypothetical protein JW926_18470 [Candidatus Sumerlaeota bacterium]|nr:hypothetical protein [Candidatus Sumerlaeota bacterium]